MENGAFTDLQVLSQIAWFDEFELAQPDLRELIAKGRDFGPQDQQFVIERQRQMLAAVLPAYASAAARGLIEIATSPYYHPILPLVCDSGMGAVSHDGLPLPQRRFQHPEDALEQIVRALALHERVFGVKPRGMWPSEGSVSDETLAIAHSAGIRWMASDEGVLGRSIGRSFARDGQGHLHPDAAESLYRIYRWSQHSGAQEQKDTAMHMIFRDHSLSGWAKTAWILFVCVLPFVGIFVYLITRGQSMADRDARQVQDADKAFKDYVREAADTDADQLAKLADLRDKGTLTDSEFQQAKAKILA